MFPTLFFAFFCAVPVSISSAIPYPLSHQARPASRVAEYDDIASTFTSFYKVSSSCADSITFGDYSVDKRQVALLQMSAIREDGNICTGSFPMAIVSEATVERPGLLGGLNLAGFQDALNVNSNAGKLVESTNTSMLLGWHAGNRLCGQKTYTPETIYFIIKEGAPFKISLSKGASTDLVTIPPYLRSLLIIAPNNNICFFADRSSAAGSNPTIVTTQPDGTTITTVVTPDGPSTAPTPTPDVFEPSPESMAPEPTPSVPPQVMQTPSPDPSAAVGPEATPQVDGDGPMPSPDATQPQGPNVEGETPIPSGPEETDEGPIIDAGIDEDGGSACFPGSAQVELASGQVVSMAELRLGDMIRTVEGMSRVIFFTHQERKRRYSFVRLTTGDGRTLMVSPEHYVYSEGGLRAASTVRVGDRVEMGDGEEDIVRFVESVSAVGLFNPQTENGELVVDGFRVSAYTTAVHPKVAHHVLMPIVRMAYRVVPGAVSWLTDLFENGNSQLAGILPGPRGIYT